jgi:flagellar motor component MotA
MGPTVVVAVVLLGMFNTVSSVYFLGQDTSTSLIGIGMALAIVAVLYFLDGDVQYSVWSVAVVIIVSNLVITGAMISTHTVKAINSALYTPSAKFVKQQAEYKKLLD